MQSYFIWNGVDCRSKGIHLTGPVPIIRAEERVKHVTIPGRSGELTLLEGDNIYNSYIQSAEIHVKGAYRVREVYRWLRGSGYVTFHSEPDKRQEARIIGAVTLEKISRNLDVWVGQVQFYCAPYKTKLTDSAVTVTSSGTDVYNMGDVTAKPVITVTTTAGSTVVVSVGGNTLTIDMSELTDTGCIIDSAAQTVTNLTGTANYTSLSSGAFPVLTVGANEITGSGWTSLDIVKGERYL